VDGASGFEDLAPSCGTGADGDYSDPGGLMVCGICLFPSNACICENPNEKGSVFKGDGRNPDQRGGQPCGNKEAKSQ
jgi:hypothetical protein